MNTRCAFCSANCMGDFCLQCNEMNRSQKFARFLQLLEEASESVMYYDEIVSTVKQIQNVSYFRIIIRLLRMYYRSNHS
jgi:hypothetical protein